MSNETLTELDKIAAFAKDHAPEVKITTSPSGRKIKLEGTGGEASIWLGAGDGKWRIKVGTLVEEISDGMSAIREALLVVDNKYSQKIFQEQCSVLKEGESDDEDND